MKPVIHLTTLILAWTIYQPSAQAQHPWLLFDGCRWAFLSLCQEWRERKCWCPDDYCPKSLPCVPPNSKGYYYDYCAKPLPCVPPNPKGCYDDYCPKTCPIFLGRLCEPWYSCGPPDGASGGGCQQY